LAISAKDLIAIGYCRHAFSVVNLKVRQKKIKNFSFCGAYWAVRQDPLTHARLGGQHAISAEHRSIAGIMFPAGHLHFGKVEIKKKKG